MGFSCKTQGSYTWLVYEVESTDIIDTVTMGMITNNQIEGVVQTTISQMNMNQYLRYNISGKINMRDYLDEMINKKTLLGLCYSIIETLEMAQGYMIEEHSFIFDKEYIYINFTTLKAALVCLPIAKNEEGISFKKFLSDIVKDGCFDQSENTDYVGRILSYLNAKEPFTIEGLRRVLDEVSEQKKEIEPVLVEKKEHVKESVHKVLYVPDEIHEIKQKAPLEVKAPVEQMPNIQQPIAQEEKVEKSKKWSLFNREPKVEVKKEKKEKRSKKEKQNNKESSVAKFNFDIPNQSPNVTPLVTHDAAVQVSQDKINENRVNSYNEESTHVKTKTDILIRPIGNVGTVELPYSQAEGTVELGMQGTVELNDGINHTKVACFHRLKTNKRYFIEGSVSRIGKEFNSVDIVIPNAAAISRVHAIIFKRGELYYIKDENSKNGTYVNEKRLVSNGEQIIENDTKIKLADEEFIFTCK